MHMRPKDFQGIVRRLLLYVFPLVLLLFWGFSSYEKNLENQALLRIQGEQEKGGIILANLLEATFSQYVSDLLVVFNSAELSNYSADSGDSHRQELEQLFVRIAIKKEYINHIRFIDKQGVETIQVDHISNGSAEPTSLLNLENLSTSPLFLAGHDLPSNGLYVSDIQHYFDGIHENPAFFLALPVYSGSEFFGLLVIDYDACYLLSFFSAYQSSLSKDIAFGLLDNEGYWILQGDQSCTDIASERVLFSEAPLFEKIVLQEEPDHFVTEDKVYRIQAVKPRSTENLVWYPEKNRLWSIVSSFNLQQLAELDQNYILSHPQVKWLLSLLMLFIGGVYVIFLQLRSADKQQMRVSSLISDYASNGIVVTDGNNRITFCNHAFEVLSGYAQNDLIQEKTEHYRIEGVPTYLYEKDFTPHDSNKLPIWIRHQSHLFILANFTINEVFSENQRLEHRIEVYGNSVWNVCDYVTYAEELQYDPTVLFPHLARAIGANDPFCCLLIQLKHFKEFESQFSQVELTGFSVAVASFLAHMLGTKEPVYIFSPTNYLLMLKGEFSNQQIVIWANELLATMETPFTYLAKQVDIHATCGIACFPRSGVDCFQLILNACLATRMVQESKSSPILVYNEEIHSQYLRRQAILEEIPKAFGTGQLDLHYQAQIDIPTNRIKGCEALIRWNHPTLGIIRPDEFIPLMEKNNLIALLGNFVIRSAMDFLNDNKKSLKQYAPDFSLAINLTADELTNTSLTDLIKNELKDKGIEAGRLSIELTERTAVENLETAERILKELRALGISIAIDDFGTGFSSLSYLLELSIDKLKIDRSFIASYPDSQAITIFKTVVLLANELGVIVIAEGVETEEQLQFLKEIGCSQYQGFLFSKAVEGKVFLAQLAAQNS